jgi:hypothetical protein
LNKEWANALYSRTKNTRLYEKVYYQWGTLWMYMTNTFLSV